jgi:predicted MPP superfamily phosphohydrolase
MDLINIQSAPATLTRLIAPASASPGTSENAGWLELFGPRKIEWNRLNLPLADRPTALQGLHILHITDLHLRRRWPLAYDAMLRRIQADPPDLLLFTGDWVNNKRNHRPAMPLVRRMLAGFRAKIGCFAIHGNHDNYAIGEELDDRGVTFLDGRRRLIDTAGGPIELIGFPGKDRIELTDEFVESLPPRDSSVPRIVLSHFPDHLRRTGGLDADLFLSGHTHGGQVCLPGGKALISHDSLPLRFAKGAHRVGNTWLVVGRGLGFTGLPIRMNCPPEVIEIVFNGQLTVDS